MTQAIVIAEPTLDELATTINREHDLTKASLSTAVDHAIKTGLALQSAREIVPQGQWLEWLRSNVTVSIREATHYIRIAAYRELVSEATSYKSALRLIAGQPDANFRGALAGQWVKTARELRRTGKSYREIATIVGVSAHSVARQLDPEMKQRYLDTAARKRRQRAAERKALERQERDAEMKHHGGDAWDAYVLIRKLAPLLDQLKLASAYARCAAIEDELVRLVKETT